MISVFSLDRCAASAALLSACDDAFHMYATPQERATLDRLRLAEARSAYRISHGALRLAIRQTTGEFPVTLLRSASGKPFCPDGPEFSLSHSGDLTVIAVSPRKAVGLDVERIGATGETETPLSIAVTPEETRLLPRLAKSSRHAEIMLWSIKEAALKLTGEVMTSPQDIAVRQHGDVFEVQASRTARAPFPKVYVRLLPLWKSYVAALAGFVAATPFVATQWSDALTPALALDLD